MRRTLALIVFPLCLTVAAGAAEKTSPESESGDVLPRDVLSSGKPGTAPRNPRMAPAATAPTPAARDVRVQALTGRDPQACDPRHQALTGRDPSRVDPHRQALGGAMPRPVAVPSPAPVRTGIGPVGGVRR